MARPPSPTSALTLVRMDSRVLNRSNKTRPNEATDSFGERRTTQLRTISIAEQIADDLGAEILNDRLKVGQRLGEDALATRFNVSRGPVRSALRILERRGLAQFYPRRGAFVAKLAPESFRDAIEIRFWLLVLAARCCARNRDSRVPAILRAQLSLLNELASERAASPSTFAHEVSVLYQIIVEHSGNPRLAPILQQTLDNNAWALIWRHWTVDYTTRERRLECIKTFETLCKAVGDGDIDRAEAAARRHLEDSLAVFLKLVKERV
jgi:DNA-binding GntR family transcriptional regulator